MKKWVYIIVMMLICNYLYSQKVERWERDSVVYKLVEDTATLNSIKSNPLVKCRIGFLGNFYKDKMKVKIGRQVLIDTIVTTREDTGNRERDDNVYTSELKVKNCCSKKIEFVMNGRKIKFPFKPGYYLIYFSFYEKDDNDNIMKTGYSLTYTNEYFIHL